MQQDSILTINNKKYKPHVLIRDEAIQARLIELAAQLDHDYAGLPVTALVTLNGAMFFAVDLLRKMQHSDLWIESIRLSSYIASQSSGFVEALSTLKKDNIQNRHLIIMEDIVETGASLNFLLEYLSDYNPASVKICSLLQRPASFRSQAYSQIQSDYVAFSLPGKEFIVGYGLDLDQWFRNIPHLISLTPWEP